MGATVRAMVRVVVAEDYMPLRELLEVRFGLLDDVELVGQAEDGPEALELVGTLQPDVLLLDLALPGMNGHEVIAEVRRRFSTVDIVVLTGVAALETRQRAIDAGAAACLVKTPNVIGGVIETIRLIGRRRANLPG
jgi:DNA-binding NarL/FixJ family response regulator